MNQLIIRFFYKQSDKIITVSNQIKVDLNLYYNIPNHKIHVIYKSILLFF